MPYRSEAEAVLAMWREVQRGLDALLPDSEEAKRLTEEVALLRSEHQRLIDEARRNHRLEPAPWPERERAGPRR